MGRRKYAKCLTCGGPVYIGWAMAYEARASQDGSHGRGRIAGETTDAANGVEYCRKDCERVL